MAPMRVTNPGLLKQFDAFIDSIKPEDKVGLFFDDDPDGVCSGALVALALKRIHNKGTAITLCSSRLEYGVTDEHVKAFKKAGVTKVITCDNAIEEHADPVEKIAEFADVLELDNHAICGHFTKKNILMMKPQLYIANFDYSKYCTSKLVYDLFSRHCDLRDRDWVAVTGCISDISTEPWMDWIRSVFRKYKVKMQKDFFKTDLGKVGIYINDSISYNARYVHDAFDAVIEAHTPQEFLRSPIKKHHHAVETELQRWTKGIEKNGEWHRDLDVVFYHVKPKFRIKSALSTILGLKYPHWTIIISAPEKKSMTLSARRGDRKVAVNRLFQVALEGLPNAAGGGHIPAAGGGCRLKDFPLFKSRVIELLRSGFTGL
ncbi:MAG TPA: DHH family phosphoesterase [Candidatus Binatia bacterium]|nr:DHH family phosphoesterase [Candidatus Binatia bacterium]